MDAAPADVIALGVLTEPQRARIYNYLAAANGPRTRQDVADALDIGRTLVAFHVDKLEQARLIASVAPEAVARGRPGRPAQWYQVTQPEISASVPPRRYELLAEILVRAAGEHAPPEPLDEAALRVARRRGRDLAAEGAGAEPHSGDMPGLLRDLLTRLGYKPSDESDSFVLTNCPFHRLRVLDTRLVCSINAALATGYLEGLGADGHFAPRLRPCPTNCCVVLDRLA
jgi:predicted ArsR family transcriptional regulator